MADALLSENSFGAPEIAPDELIYGDKIGGGCFGSVYKGECRGKEVAIKKLFRQEMSAKALADFKKEVQICARLHHPNVLLFMGACTEPGHMAIVMELMPKGNLETLLHDPQRSLSLARRMIMAKGAALGMNWLHCSKPMIIHRDLKPSNLLVDSHGVVKVCDFGLSAVKPYGEKLKDTDSIPGTPLWMAPEVMMGRLIDEKADVYAFGIVLWEIATLQIPFPDQKSFPTFKKAICIQGLRPPIPEDTQPSLKQLMDDCWHKDPGSRPSFAEVIQRLDGIVTDCAIEDAIGRDMWKSKFPGKDAVKWSVFWKTLYTTLQIPIPSDGEENIHVRCLKEVIAVEGQDKTLKVRAMEVELETFGKFTASFGPLVVGQTTVLDRLHDLLKQPYYFGDCDRTEAEAHLQKCSKGYYLVRTSATVATSFTISKVSKKGKINHQRVEYSADKGFSIKIQKSGATEVVTKPTLQELLTKMSGPLYLQKPCPGAKYYTRLFEKRKIDAMEGYLLDNDEE